MIRSLLAIGQALHRAWLAELFGAALIVVGLYLGWGMVAALIGAGAALLLKAWDIEAGDQ